MNILITGGYGFIGSHAADRFFNEGHGILVIDNLTSGNPDNVKVDHRFYRYDVEDIRCEAVFKENPVDIVIHLAAQADVNTSMKYPYLDARSNILGLVNMLDLSVKYGVKKFIFASSAAVYGNSEKVPLGEEEAVNPMSPYGISKSVGELYCRKWNEIYGLNTLCFRFSNVFGPRQGTKGEGGVISIFIERILNDRQLTVFGDGSQTRDFIYVEDLADALYKSCASKCKGIYNLSTNTQNSVNKLIKELNSLCPVKDVVYSAPRQGDILNSRLDNSKLVSELGWEPQTSFEEGIKRTLRWFSNYLKGL